METLVQMPTCCCWWSLLGLFVQDAKELLSKSQIKWQSNALTPTWAAQAADKVLARCSLPPSQTGVHLLLILIPWPQPKTWSAYMSPLRCSSSVPEVSYCLMIQYYRNITVEISCFIFVSFSTDLSIISCIILYFHKARKSSNRYFKILTSIFPPKRFL